MTEQTLVILPWQRRVLILAKLIFTLLIAGQLAAFTWMILSPETLVLPEPTRAQGVTQVAANDSIANSHLFGLVDVEVKDVPQEIDAPQTRLRLELLGVMATSKAENSSAIIAQKGREGEHYKVGDIVQGRTKLAAVHQDKVILDNSGKLEALKFDLTRPQAIQRSSRPTPSQRKSQSRLSLQDRFKKIRTPADAVELLQSEVASNPEAALKKLGLEVSDNGSGYKVSSSASMLTQLGLQSGDIILSVNGQTLGSLDDDQMLLEQVSRSGQARLEIQRGNRRFVVNHTIK